MPAYKFTNERGEVRWCPTNQDGLTLVQSTVYRGRFFTCVMGHEPYIQYVLYRSQKRAERVANRVMRRGEKRAKRYREQIAREFKPE